MSNLVFPKLAGQAWPIEREARWTTEVRETPSGREFRAGSMSTPRWMYRLRFDVLRQGADGELAQLLGFFNLHRGALDSFLFEDEDDKAVSAQQFALVVGRHLHHPGSGFGVHQTGLQLHSGGGSAFLQ